MYSRIGKTNYWPLWDCISVESLVKLSQYQWDRWGTRLDIITGHDIYEPELEPIEEIDKIMRRRPHSPKRVK